MGIRVAISLQMPKAEQLIIEPKNIVSIKISIEKRCASSIARKSSWNVDQGGRGSKWK
jgi:hypothetical protein